MIICFRKVVIHHNRPTLACTTHSRSGVAILHALRGASKPRSNNIVLKVGKLTRLEALSPVWVIRSDVSRASYTASTDKLQWQIGLGCPSLADERGDMCDGAERCKTESDVMTHYRCVCILQDGTSVKLSLNSSSSRCRCWHNQRLATAVCSRCDDDVRRLYTDFAIRPSIWRGE
jgi:hypothetical protein